MKQILKLLIPLFGLAACGPLVELSSSGPAPQVFTLSHNLSIVGPYVEPKARIFIEEPVADGLLSNTRIAIRISDTEVRYLPQARWSDRPARLLRASVHDGLGSVNGLTPLSTGALEVPTDYRLKLRIRAFNAIEDGNALLSRASVTAILLSDVGPEILATKDFDANLRANSSAASDIVKALDEAQNALVGELSVWVAEVLMGEALQG